jgi:hypothetical protein
MAEPEMIESIKVDLQRPNLTNRELMAVFQAVFPLVPEGRPVTSGCWVMTGHGSDLDARVRPTLIDEMLGAFEDFEGERAALSRYITNNVSLTMAMGLPGPSAPMQVQLEDNERWAGLTTSEADVQIIRNIYQLFDQYMASVGNPPVTPDMLDVLDYIVKQQLRANFIQIWGPGGEFKLKKKGNWQTDVSRLMRMEEIWVSKRLTASSVDRHYQLRPNGKDEDEFRAREGLHLIDMRDRRGFEIPDLVLPVGESGRGPHRNPLPDTDEFDINNLQFPEARARLEHYFYVGLNIQRGTKEDIAFKLILDKIFSKRTPDVFLSELILLGYILRIQHLQIFDPLCRPLADEHFEGDTRSGAAYKGTVPAVEALQYETFPREGSEKVLSRITKKCDKKGVCTMMGGKTRRPKKTSRTKKTKRTRTRKSNKGDKKRTRKHRHK